MMGREDGNAIIVVIAYIVGQVPSGAKSYYYALFGIRTNSAVGNVAGSAFLERYPVRIIHAGMVVKVIIV